LVAPRESTVVVLLGTGMPRPDPDTSGPATAVVVGERVFLVDAGPGVERRLNPGLAPGGGRRRLRRLGEAREVCSAYVPTSPNVHNLP
jgi:hypothetical protein